LVWKGRPTENPRKGIESERGKIAGFGRSQTMPALLVRFPKEGTGCEKGKGKKGKGGKAESLKKKGEGKRYQEEKRIRRTSGFEKESTSNSYEKGG